MGILLVGFLLRVVWLDYYPPGFTPDEASFGYDAYSILKTGKDQWGRTFPLVLESFGDFKSPLYAYLTVPFVALLGLTKTAVRLPNALLGAAAIGVTYLLVKELFKKEKIALLAAAILAISPWHLPLSRGAFEANLTVFFLPLAVYLFLKKKYPLSGLVFGLNLFTYHSAKLITPLVLVSLIFFYKEKLKKCWSTLAVFGLFLGATIITFLQGANARVVERLISDPTLFVDSYLTYLSPQFFFSQGPAEGTYGMVPGRGVLAWYTLPFLILFLINFKKQREYFFLAAWILFSPIPAALATGVGYHANRAAVMMPAIQIALAMGASQALDWFRKRRVSGFAFGFLIFLFFSFFLYDYFVLSPAKIGPAMLEGNIKKVEELVDQYPEGEVVVPRSLSEPHIFVAFSQEIDPKQYQKATKTWNYQELGLGWVDQMPEYQLGRFVFK